MTLADISEKGAGDRTLRAAEAGVTIDTRQVDLETAPLPAPTDADGPPGWDLILTTLYLNRGLFPQFAEALCPGGLLVVIHPTPQ